MSDSDVPDVVVVGRRNQKKLDFFRADSSTFATVYNPPDGPTRAPGQPTSPTPAPAAAVGDISVNVEIDDPANLEAAVQASQNVATALAAWLDQLESVDPADTITVVGQRFTVDMALNLIRNIRWVITDRRFEGINTGVGMAVSATRTDFPDFRNFIASNPLSYAAPGYTNGEGMMFIIMHEIAHLSASGVKFRDINISYYSRTHSDSTAGYNSSPQFANVEKWANDIAAAMMRGNLQFDLGKFSNPKYGYGATLPAAAGRK